MWCLVEFGFFIYDLIFMQLFILHTSTGTQSEFRYTVHVATHSSAGGKSIRNRRDV